MQPASAAPTPTTARPPAEAPPRRSLRPLGIPLALAALLASFVLVPQARENPRLGAGILGAAGVLVAWTGVLWARSVGSRRALRIETSVVRAHYVQALVQGSIYVYWSMHWPEIRAQAPLIVSQVVYLYAFDALMSWTRGRPWHLGFGPLPILFSTNLLLWFRDDWFVFQYAMVTVGALGKEFLRWTREGRNVHLFNPSVFGQSAAAVVLLSLGLTDQLTRGSEMASAFERLPHMLVFLFLLGLIVQSLFAVTLMTMAATAVLCLVNLIYTEITGTFYFTTISIGATIFLGLHLLVTDPSTSPRTNLGRTIFGGLYGLGYCVLFMALDEAGAPVFWDKLLPVPILNLSVPLIDRFARSGVLGRINRAWEGALRPSRMNLVHMGAWTALFLGLLLSGFADGPAEGRSIAFWRKAYDEGRHRADDNLLVLVKHEAARGDGEACNMLGKLLIEGELLPQDEAAAAYWFAKACEAGDPIGCENVAGQFLFQRRANSPEDVERAFAALESRIAAERDEDGVASFLVGRAHETGTGRPLDPARARELYAAGCGRGNPDCCAAAARLDRTAALGR